MSTQGELDLKDFLGKYRNKTVDFYRFPGNYGDSLIWHGTKALLRSLDITENYVEPSSPRQNEVLLVDGGGNFVDYYSDVRDFLMKRSDVYDEIVILPHTIFGDRQVEVLNGLSGRVTVFCREMTSYDLIRERFKKGSVHVWHDCSFYTVFGPVPQGRGVLNAFRGDKESVNENMPPDNRDISCDGYATKPLDELLNVLKEYREIRTDRLHIAICGALLGKEVKLFPNSYYKNKAVFEYSLSRFPNVSFMEKNNDQFS